jgi:zinc transport system substrate-binding protein
VHQFVASVGAALFGAFLAASAMAQDKARVVAVNYPLQYFAERLLGDAAEVEFLVPQDVDPSFWRPSVADISAIQSADLILLNGASFATWVDRVSLPRSKLVNTSASVSDKYIFTESITHSHGEGDEHSHEGVASYLWLDPTLAIAQAEVIAAAIITRDLAPEGEVEEALDLLRKEFNDLDSYARDALSELKGVSVLTTHPRYQYLARAYGLEVHALEWDAGAAPSAANLGDLRALASAHGARLLIWEADPPAEAVQAVADLGLASVIFPPQAHRPGEGSFLESYRQSIADLADISGQLTSN